MYCYTFLLEKSFKKKLKYQLTVSLAAAVAPAWPRGTLVPRHTRALKRQLLVTHVLKETVTRHIRA